MSDKATYSAVYGKLKNHRRSVKIVKRVVTYVAVSVVVATLSNVSSLKYYCPVTEGTVGIIELAWQLKTKIY